jgi:hypothetical protein
MILLILIVVLSAIMVSGYYNRTEDRQHYFDSFTLEECEQLYQKDITTDINNGKITGFEMNLNR